MRRDAFRSLACSLRHMISKWQQLCRGGSILSKFDSNRVCQRQVPLSRCQPPLKRLIPAMAQQRTGLSDCTAAHQRQPDTRHVLSREQAIRVYDRQGQCAHQTTMLRSFDCVERMHNTMLCRAGAAIKDSSSVYGGECAICCCCSANRLSLPQP